MSDTSSFVSHYNRLAPRQPRLCTSHQRHTTPQVESTTAGAHLRSLPHSTASQPCSPALGLASTPGVVFRSPQHCRSARTPPYASQHVAKSPASGPGCGRGRRGGGLGSGVHWMLCVGASPRVHNTGAAQRLSYKPQRRFRAAAVRKAAASESMARCHHSAAASRAKR